METSSLSLVTVSDLGNKKKKKLNGMPPLVIC